MSFFNRLPWRPRVDEEVDEELAFHVEMRTREYIARGVDPAAARLEAERGFGDLADRVEAFIGHCDAADIGLDRAKRIIRRLRRGGFGQSIEKRRFADVRQADDAAAEAHDFSI